MLFLWIINSSLIKHELTISPVNGDSERTREGNAFVTSFLSSLFLSLFLTRSIKTILQRSLSKFYKVVPFPPTYLVVGGKYVGWTDIYKTLCQYSCNPYSSKCHRFYLEPPDRIVPYLHICRYRFVG